MLADLFFDVKRLIILRSSQKKSSSFIPTKSQRGALPLPLRHRTLFILAAPEVHVQLHHWPALALALLDRHLRHSQPRHLGRGERCSGRGGRQACGGARGRKTCCTSCQPFCERDSCVCVRITDRKSSVKKPRFKNRCARVGLRDKVEPTTLANILYRFWKLILVPVEGKCHRGGIRIDRHVGAYVVGHDFHRRGRAPLSCCNQRLHSNSSISTPHTGRVG